MRSGGTDHQNAFYTSGTYFIFIFSISPLQNLYHARAGNTARAQHVQVYYLPFTAASNGAISFWYSGSLNI